MLKNEREQEIISLLRTNGYISVHQLSRSLYISESTARRALADLEEKGLVRRSYGGAELVEGDAFLPSFNSRLGQNIENKQQIAVKAANLVKDGSVIFLDQSSTSLFLAWELLSRKDLTIMTNNVEILNLLAPTDHTVYSSGGRLCQRNRMCLVDAEAERSFGSMYANFAFFSARSLSEDGVISDCTRDEIHVRNAMLGNADCKVFLCDSTKIGERSVYRQCSLADVDYLICDSDVGGTFRERYPRLQIL